MSTQRYGIPTKGRYSPFLDVTPRSQTPIRVQPSSHPLRGSLHPLINRSPNPCFNLPPSSVLSLQLSPFTNHQSLFFRVFTVLFVVSFFRSTFRLPWSTLGSCVLVRLSLSVESVRLPSPSTTPPPTTPRRVASPKATPSYKM